MGRGPTVKGKFGGINSITVAKLMGCSVWIAKKNLYKFESPPNLQQIGEMVYEYKAAKEESKLNARVRSLLGF